MPVPDGAYIEELFHVLFSWLFFCSPPLCSLELTTFLSRLEERGFVTQFRTLCFCTLFASGLCAQASWGGFGWEA